MGLRARGSSRCFLMISFEFDWHYIGDMPFWPRLYLLSRDMVTPNSDEYRSPKFTQDYHISRRPLFLFYTRPTAYRRFHSLYFDDALRRVKYFDMIEALIYRVKEYSRHRHLQMPPAPLAAPKQPTASLSPDYFTSPLSKNTSHIFTILFRIF